MGLVYLLVVLATGHIFCLLHLPARYRLRVSDGWEAYFHVGAHGVVFVTAAFVIYFVADVFFGLSIPGVNRTTLTGFPLSFQEAELAFLALLSLLLASGVGGLSLLWLRNDSLRWLPSVTSTWAFTVPFPSGRVEARLQAIKNRRHAEPNWHLLYEDETSV